MTISFLGGARRNPDDGQLPSSRARPFNKLRCERRKTLSVEPPRIVRWHPKTNPESVTLMPYIRQIPFAAGSPTSYEAALAADKFISRQGLAVYKWLVSRGRFGGTQVEAMLALGISRPSLCARFRGLEQAGAIWCNKTRRRDRCAVYEVVGPHPQQPALRFEER